MTELITLPYLVLYASLATLLTTWAIAAKDRKSTLNREIYFKKQQAAERIIEGLSRLENEMHQSLTDFDKFINTPENIKNIDTDKTFEEVASLVEIYFYSINQTPLLLLEAHIANINMSMMTDALQYRKNPTGKLPLSITQDMETKMSNAFQEIKSLVKADLRKIENRL